MLPNAGTEIPENLKPFRSRYSAATAFRGFQGHERADLKMTFLNLFPHPQPPIFRLKIGLHSDLRSRFSRLDFA